MIPKKVLDAAAPYMTGGYDAGEPIHTFYNGARGVFPILPEEIEVLPDTPAGTFGLAWYLGLNVNQLPKFCVRDDVVLNNKIGWHESGHAFEDVWVHMLAVKTGMWVNDAVDVMRTAYWRFRGFPGTWQDAIAMANSQSGSGAAWPWFPGESLAEAFSAAVGGYVQSEWTVTYGKDLAIAPGNLYDPTGGAMKARAFFLDMMKEVQPEEEDLTPEQDELLRRIAAILEAREPLVWQARGQRFLDVETGKPFDPNTAPKDPRIKQ